MVAGSGLLSSNCSNDDLTVDRTVPDDVVATRSSAFHWTCPDSKCGFDLNAGWQSHCGRPGCKEEYSDSHGILILTFADYIKNTVGFDTGEVVVRDLIITESNYLMENFRNSHRSRGTRPPVP